MEESIPSIYENEWQMLFDSQLKAALSNAAEVMRKGQEKGRNK